MSNPSIGALRDLQADARLDLTTLESVIIVMMRGQVDEELRRLQAFEGDVEPLARFERATYGLRNRITQENPSEFSPSFDELPGPDADPHASSHISYTSLTELPSDFSKLKAGGSRRMTASASAVRSWASWHRWMREWHARHSYGGRFGWVLAWCGEKQDRVGDDRRTAGGHRWMSASLDE